MTRPRQIVFDRGPGGLPFGFSDPRHIIRADDPADVPEAMQALALAQERGLWLAGYASYELGYVLEPRLTSLLPEGRRHPLLLFGAFEEPVCPSPFSGDSAVLSEPRPLWQRDRYTEAFRKAADWIAAGDIYQVNLTFPLAARTEGSAEALYGALVRHQPVGHGAFVDLGEGPRILSRSPELFFRTDGTGQIETAPMKGTARRDADPVRDQVLRHELATSEKNRAENLMIVDLLRNDLSRICTVGSVRVPEIYKIESYATVHQMISRVIGQLLPHTSLVDILRALFPCGSVTGAPKIRAMEVIRALEPQPRGVYCGSIGWAAPDGRAEFNVAIRTLSLFDKGEVSFNVGGGIVHDSTAEGEYEEALWKARYTRLA